MLSNVGSLFPFVPVLLSRHQHYRSLHHPPPTVTMIILLVCDVLSNLSTLLFVMYVLPCHCPLAPLYVIITLLRHVFVINKACNVLCSQSLCEVVVNSCRELELQSSFMFRVVALLFWNIVIAVTEFVAVLRGCIRVETFIVTKKPVYLCCVILYFVPCKIVLFYIGAPCEDVLTLQIETWT